MTSLPPSDDWIFLDTADDDEEESVRPPELAAVHVSKLPPVTPARDPGATDVALGDEPLAAPHIPFDDEEPEADEALPVDADAADLDEHVASVLAEAAAEADTGRA